MNAPEHSVAPFIRPDIRRRRIVVDTGPTDADSVHLAIEGTSYEVQGPPGELVLDFPEFDAWSPENPRRYILRWMFAYADNPAARRTAPFAMREFTAKERQFFLNNCPYYVKGVVYRPEPDHSVRKALELAKQAGFNMVRTTCGPAFAEIVEAADDLGLLVFAQIEPEKTARSGEEACRNRISGVILEYRNNPSVVAWLVSERPNAAQDEFQPIGDAIHAADPTRLIFVAESSCSTGCRTRRFIRPYRDEYLACHWFRARQHAPVDREIELYFAHGGDPEALSFLEEFGFGGLAKPPQTSSSHTVNAGDALIQAVHAGFDKRGHAAAFDDFPAFVEATQNTQADAARYQIDAVRSNPACAGYCWDALTDDSQSLCCGILNRRLEPKKVFQTLRKVQAPLRPIIQVPRTNLTPRQEMPVSIRLPKEARFEGLADVSLQVVGPTNQVLWKKKRGMRLPHGGKELWSGAVSASGSTGVHHFVARIMQGMTRLAESALPIHVFDPAAPSGINVHVIDTTGDWQARCAPLARLATPQAPVHIVPPLANTIRAYPDNDLAHVLAQVEGGAAALVFSPPDDWNDLADCMDPALRATSRVAAAAYPAAYHFSRIHPLFDGLPARGMLGPAYRNVLPPKTFVEPSDEDMAGALALGPALHDPSSNTAQPAWGSDVLVKRYGSGRIAFTHFRILEHLGQDPVADILFVNMLKHFSRRSLPSKGILRLHQPSVEWLRTERNTRVRRWMVIGMFPNWGGRGHDIVFPPENEIDFAAAYPGWYKAVAWKPWYSVADDRQRVNLEQALAPPYHQRAVRDEGTAYAYAEFTADRRRPAALGFRTDCAARIWMNGTAVHENSEESSSADTASSRRVPIFIKQGRNTMLIKVSRTRGDFVFDLSIENAGPEPVQLKWWR